MTFDPRVPSKRAGSSLGTNISNIDGDLKIEHGWIAYKEASTPEEPCRRTPGEAFHRLATMRSTITRPAGRIRRFPARA